MNASDAIFIMVLLGLAGLSAAGVIKGYQWLLRKSWLRRLSDKLIGLLPDGLQHKLRLGLSQQQRITGQQKVTWQQELTIQAWFSQQVLLSGISCLLLLVNTLQVIGLLGMLWLALRAVHLWLQATHAQRQARRELPAVLDALAMLLQAGSTLTSAMQQVAVTRPNFVLGQQFQQLVNAVRTGAVLAESLESLQQRLAVREVTLFVTLAKQSIKTGAALADSLSFQAQQRRGEALLAAEKRAQEAPIKLLFPLVTCFFPVSFILLLGPIFLGISLE